MADVADSAAAGDSKPELDISSQEVLTKYNAAGDIANAALRLVIAACVPGKKIVEICAIGDAHIKSAVTTCFGKVKDKGIGFPTCISVNECCGHFSPLEDDATELKEGDVAKIDLGVQIDGFMALVAHTLVVGATGPVSGRKADVIAAANAAAEVVARTLKAGAKNSDITKLIERTIAAYQCQAVDGALSQQVKQFKMDGEKSIQNKTAPDRRIAECTIEMNEVYVVDLVVSTGEGKARELDAKPTVFKRDAEKSYALKLKASRELFHNIKEKAPNFPFNLREFEGTRAKLGVRECVEHGLLEQYPVLYERADALVAQIKFTVLIGANGGRRITGAPLQEIQSELKIEDEEILAILAAEIKAPKKKKKKAAAAEK